MRPMLAIYAHETASIFVRFPLQPLSDLRYSIADAVSRDAMARRITMQGMVEVSDDKIGIIVDILGSLSRKPGVPIGPDTQVLQDEIIDSLSVFHVIAEIESRCGVSIGVMDATLEDFATPAAIVALLHRLEER